MIYRIGIGLKQTEQPNFERKREEESLRRAPGLLRSPPPPPSEPQGYRPRYRSPSNLISLSHNHLRRPYLLLPSLFRPATIPPPRLDEIPSALPTTTMGTPRAHPFPCLPRTTSDPDPDAPFLRSSPPPPPGHLRAMTPRKPRDGERAGLGQASAAENRTQGALPEKRNRGLLSCRMYCSEARAEARGDGLFVSSAGEAGAGGTLRSGRKTLRRSPRRIFGGGSGGRSGPRWPLAKEGCLRAELQTHSRANPSAGRGRGATR